MILQWITGLYILSFTHCFVAQPKLVKTALKDPFSTSGGLQSSRPHRVVSLFERPPQQEALDALSSYHNGSWRGQSCSFAVKPDVMAGIVGRKKAAYSTSVKFPLDTAGFVREECIETESQESEMESGTSVVTSTSLSAVNADVDDVDGSYSLEVSDSGCLPAELTGTTRQFHWGMEHCLALSENNRARCWALYNEDGSLLRIVLSEETRSEDSDAVNGVNGVNGLSGINGSSKQGTPRPTTNTTSSSVSLETIQQLATESRTNRNKDSGNQLSPHIMSLMELSSGVWLGDTIIRETKVPTVPGTGFGSSPSVAPTPKFASWTLGVQKVARRWMWDFGEEVRQINDFGRGMGTESLLPTRDLPGVVCVNEGLSRRIAPPDRMVYVNWQEENVGFLLGAFTIQVPRYMNFDQARRGRPFHMEFCAYQALSPEFKNDDDLPELVCSKIERVYNYEGRLKQGCTSFYTLRRFGKDDDEEDDEVG